MSLRKKKGFHLSIAFGSINTGLPKDIVEQIMAAERVPIKSLETRKGKLEEKKGLVTELSGLVETLRTNLAKSSRERDLREFKVKANEEIVDVTVDKDKALPGEYQFEVVELAQKSSALSSGFADKDESYVGVGFIQYTLPDGEDVEIFIDPDNASLNGIAKLINSDPKNGVRASVINDGTGTETPWRLLLSLEKTGDKNNAEFPYFYFVDGDQDLYLEFERQAHDALVKVDGFEIEVDSNKASELIPGVTIDLKRASPGEEFTIKITEDAEAITGKIKEIVEGINTILKFIKEQNALDENTDTSRTLGGEGMLQSLETRLRGAIFRPIVTSEGTMRLSNLGIQFQRNGLLSFEEQTFNAKVNGNYRLASEILVGHRDDEGRTHEGFIQNVNAVASDVLRPPSGLIKSRGKNFETTINQIDQQIQRKEKHLEQKERTLKDKFARLEGVISKIKGQGAGIAAMGAPPADAVTQLG